MLFCRFQDRRSVLFLFRSFAHSPYLSLSFFDRRPSPPSLRRCRNHPDAMCIFPFSCRITAFLFVYFAHKNTLYLLCNCAFSLSIHNNSKHSLFHQVYSPNNIPDFCATHFKTAQRHSHGFSPVCFPGKSGEMKTVLYSRLTAAMKRFAHPTPYTKSFSIHSLLKSSF